MVILKPTRSDDSFSEEEHAKYLKQAQDFFNKAAPKRTRKPRRSESDDDPTTLVAVPTEIPELKVLAELNASGEVILKGKATVAEADEHLETNYYQGIETPTDHVQFGTAFIPLQLKPFTPYQVENSKEHKSIRTNPATNEWTPAPSDFVATSSKPGRSDE
eukprot:TRINITY_DN2488_c0_g1_i1.p1 TRINITY_DN2488_c0_g1~~TRINITY_DN2488_c0_g1_i1.p1  ORF type:complete len:161 (+),score=26.91 TRINITY_DN2488_c0_g1_i1:123-605(+)